MKNNKNTKTVSMKIILTESQTSILLKNLKNEAETKINK